MIMISRGSICNEAAIAKLQSAMSGFSSAIRAASEKFKGTEATVDMQKSYIGELDGEARARISKFAQKFQQEVVTPRTRRKTLLLRAERDVLLRWIVASEDCTYCPLGKECSGLDPEGCLKAITAWMRAEARKMLGGGEVNVV